MITVEQKTRLDAVRGALGSISAQAFWHGPELSVLVAKEKLVEAMTRLRDDKRTRFHQLMDVCGVDYPDQKPRFEVIYQLLSLSHNTRLTVFVQTADGAAVPSVSGVYPAAGWFEREVYDLLGIPFSGHADLRRILTDYGFEGHPLRRDFPLMGHTQVRYDDLQRQVVHEPVTLSDPFRDFDARSPWQGMTDVQRRGEG